MSKFKIGEIVFYKTGNIPMTITKEVNERGIYEVVYVNNDNKQCFERVRQETIISSTEKIETNIDSLNKLVLKHKKTWQLQYCPTAIVGKEKDYFYSLCIYDLASETKSITLWGNEIHAVLAKGINYLLTL